MMECVIRKQGKAKSGLISITLEKDNYLIVLTRSPTDICENRG